MPGKKGEGAAALRRWAHVLQRMLKFSASSVFSAMLDFMLFMVLDRWLTTTGAYGFARVVSSAVNFELNRNAVFEVEPTARSGATYLLLALSLMLCGSLFTGLLGHWGLNTLLAKLLVDGVLFVCSYFVQKGIVFDSPSKR